MNSKKQLNEGMPAAGDLIDLVNDVISVDEYQPKIGTEFQTVTVAFFAKYEKAAEDLRTFIERGVLEFLDIEVSPNPSPEGEWAVFIEFKRDEEFWDKLNGITAEVDRLIGSKLDWKVTTYFADEEVSVDEAPAYVELEVTAYARRKIKHRQANGMDMNETRKYDEFFDGSLLTDIVVNENTITFHRHNFKTKFKLEEFAEWNTLKNPIAEGAVDIAFVPSEVKLLKEILGRNYLVESSGKLVYIQKHHSDEVMILNRYV